VRGWGLCGNWCMVSISDCYNKNAYMTLRFISVWRIHFKQTFSTHRAQPTNKLEHYYEDNANFIRPNQESLCSGG
jgi:hypothetical protein